MARTIRRTFDDAEKNAKLLDFILKQSKACLDCFQDILRKHRQEHIAKLFDAPGKSAIIVDYRHFKCCRFSCLDVQHNCIKNSAENGIHSKLSNVLIFLFWLFKDMLPHTKIF